MTSNLYIRCNIEKITALVEKGSIEIIEYICQREKRRYDKKYKECKITNLQQTQKEQDVREICSQYDRNKNEKEPRDKAANKYSIVLFYHREGSIR